MENSELLNKLKAARDELDECISVLQGSGLQKKKTGKKQPGRIVTNENDRESIVLDIVNKIKDCDESSAIEDKVLDSGSVESRVLLCFYVSKKYFENTRLSTGDVEKITSELGVRVQTPNVSLYISKSLKTYLEGDTTRKRGRAVMYRLNRKGEKHFEELLNHAK